MNLGNLIYTKRKGKGLSQEQLAEAIGVARQTVSKWETNETVPDLESMRKLAVFLEFSVDKVLGIDGLNGSTDASGRIYADMDADGDTGSASAYDSDSDSEFDSEFDADDDDDKVTWLMTGGFAIGMVLGIAFEKYILGLAFAMVGFGVGMILRALKKD